MSTQTNKTVIGVFMVSAVALLVAAVLILGSGKLFQDRPSYVMFFEGTVQGLSVGSPVIFRGVKIGEVKDIRMQFNTKDQTIRIPVIVELGQARGEEVNEDGSIGRKGVHTKAFVERLVQKGLRAQLAMQSIVTGQLMVTLDFHPNKPARFIGTEKKYPEIPTIPTPLQELAHKLEKLPIEDILNKVQEAVTAIAKIVDSPDLGATLKSVRLGVDETRSLIKNVDKHVGPVLTGVAETSGEFKKLAIRVGDKVEPLSVSIAKMSDQLEEALKTTSAVLTSVQSAMAEDSPERYRAAQALSQFEAAARSVKNLADILDRHPESLIYGKKGSKGVEK